MSLPRCMRSILMVAILLSGSGVHGTISVEQSSQKRSGPEELQDALDRCGKLVREGKYADAESATRNLLPKVEAGHGAHSLEVSRVLDILVEALWRGGKAGAPESFQLAKRALRIKEHRLGPDDPEVARSLHNLAVLLEVTGDSEKARRLHEHALTSREKALGPEHPDVAQSLNSLAALLSANGDYARARPMCERGLAIREKALGPEHPDVARSLGNLADILASTGDYAGAQPLFERALAIREKAYGPRHPELAGTLIDLARLYMFLGEERASAEHLYERAWSIREEALGLNPPRSVQPGGAPSGPPPPTRSDVITFPERPILYFDSESEDTPPLIKAVHPDGRRLGVLARGVISGWSRRGDWFAYFFGGGEDEPFELRMMNLQGRTETLFRPSAGERPCLGTGLFNWSPDQKKFGFVVGRWDRQVENWEPESFELAVLDLEKKNPPRRLILPKSAYRRDDGGDAWPPTHFRWSSDNRRILISWEDTFVIDTATGKVETIFQDRVPAEWAGGGEGVYYLSGPRDEDDPFEKADLYFKKLGSAGAVKLLEHGWLSTYGLTRPHAYQRVPFMRLSPEGTKLAIFGGSTWGGVGCIQIYDLKRGKPETLGKPSRVIHTLDFVMAIDWGPDENSLVVLEGRNLLKLKLLRLSTRTWQELDTLSEIKGTAIDVVGLANMVSWVP